MKNNSVKLLLVSLILTISTFTFLITKDESRSLINEKENEIGYSNNNKTGVSNVTIRPVVTDGAFCKKFYISKVGNYASGITSGYRNGTDISTSHFSVVEKTGDANCDGTGKYVSYCIDPGRVGPGSSGTKISYHYERGLDIDGGSTSNYDVSMVYLYQNAYPSKQVYTGSSYNESLNVAVTNAAARMLTFDAGFGTLSGAHYYNNAASYYYAVVKENGGACDATCESLRLKNNSPQLVSGVDSYGMVAKLYHEAKNATAADLWTGEIDFAKTVSVESTTVNGDGSFTKLVRGQLTGLANFNTDKSFVKNLSVECPKEDGVTCTILDGAKNPVSPDTKLNTGADTFDYFVSIKGTSTTSVKNIKVEVNIDYFDPRSFENAFVAYADVNTEYQRMVVFPEATTRAKLQTFTVNFCDMDPDSNPDYFYNYCDAKCFETPRLDPTSPEFDNDEFQNEGCCADIDKNSDLYLQYCSDNCYKSNFENVCGGEPTNEYFVKEGIDNATNEINYKVCVINQKDIAGNDLNMPVNNGTSLTGENQYCTVSCKEDWNFILPGNISDIRAGTYFMLSAQVKGERTCVSSDIKYNDKYESGYFLRDLDDVNTEIINAFNDYIFWKNGNETAAKAEARESCSWHTGHEDSEKNCTGEGSNEVCVEEEFCVEDNSGTDYGTPYNKTWSSTQYRYVVNRGNPGTGTIQKASNKNGDETIGKFDTSEGTCSKDCDWDPEDWNYITQNMNDAKARYTNAINKRNKMISDINNCSAWVNNFEFDPKISYNYEEQYYMETVIEDNNYFTASPNASNATSSTQKYCQTNANDQYECSSSTGSVKKEIKTVFDCEIGSESCNINTAKQNIPTSQNVMKYEMRENLYKPDITFYAKHPTGEVIGVSRSQASSEPELVVTKLGNVMPVRLTTKEGQYDYKFAFNDIGQFNDEKNYGDTGRLMEYDQFSDIVTDEINVTLNSSIEVSDENSVFDAAGLYATYMCHYEVYEDVCKCCGEDELDVTQPGGGGVSAGSGSSDGHFTFYYKPVSLNELFPSSSNGSLSAVEVGDNWKGAKGSEVKANIEKLGEDAYLEPEYSYKLTPTATASIRAHNNNVLNNGGFSDFNFTCNEYGYNCVSGFLNEIDDITNEDTTIVRGDSNGNAVFANFNAPNYTEGQPVSGVGPAMK